MLRRTLLTGALVAFATLGTALHPDFADARTTSYSAAKFERLKASGKPFMLDFFAVWCSTCRAQERAISGLKRTNKQLAGITVMKVNWDTHRNAEITKSLRIPRRSTLVMFKNGREVGRVVAQTSPKTIENLMKRGL